MKASVFIIRSFRLLLSHQPVRLFVLFGLTLLLGINAGFSIVLLIPLLQLLNVGSGEPSEGMASMIRNMADKFGLEINLETILMLFVFLLTLTAILQYIKSILEAAYQQSFIYLLRQRLFRKIICADWNLLNYKSKNNHLQILTKEVPNLANYFFYYLKLITSLILAITMIVYSLLISTKFTLIILVIGAGLFLGLRKFMFKSLHLGEGFVESYNQILKHIDEFWTTVKIAKVHGSENFYTKNFDKANLSLKHMEYQIQKNYAKPMLIYSISGIIVLVFVIYVGFAIDHVPLASFFILIMIFARIYPLFTSMNLDVNMILSNVASVKLVLQLDKDLPEPQPVSLSHVNHLELQKELKLVGITFAYPGGKVLFDAFNATFPAKKITGIIGESGNGKTTLIDLIAGLLKPQSGKILVDRVELVDEKLQAWKDSIGYLPQDSFFVDGTIYQNLIWDSPIEANETVIMDLLQQVNATSIIKRQKQGLHTHIVNYQYHFSGGERQRLALVRVLLRKPRLLLLDEATAALDQENERLIMEILSVLKDQVTILFVTHKQSVLPWFDKVIHIS